MGGDIGCNDPPLPNHIIVSFMSRDTPIAILLTIRKVPDDRGGKKVPRSRML